MATFYRGDIVEQLQRLPTKSIDFIYFNPPFGITAQPWDAKLPWAEVFAECFRVLKTPGTLAIHCSVPFNYTLIRAAPRAPNYSWYWNKRQPTTPLLAKKQPLRCVEEVLVWTQGQKYYPQRVGSELRIVKSSAATEYVNAATLTPQDAKEVIGRYQTHYIEMPRKLRGFATRPDEIVELFIKSYTTVGDVVLDPTCYKGLSGRIAVNLNRKWIGIDKNFYPEELLQ